MARRRRGPQGGQGASDAVLRVVIASAQTTPPRDLRAELLLALGTGGMPVRMQIVFRAKRIFGAHYGILVDAGSHGQFVIELQKGAGVRVITFEEFAQGRPVIKGAVADDLAVASARALQLLDRGWRYDLLQRNCEHAAQWVVLGQHTSGQVSVGLVAALAVMLLWASRRANDLPV